MNATLSANLPRVLTLLACLAWSSRTQAAEVEFAKPVIDIGIVAKDPDRTARFLTNALGLKEVRGFSVTGDLGRRIGLIDGLPAEARLFVTDDTPQAAHIKVLSIPKATPAQPDQAYIHSALGIRYLTLFVKNLNPAIERLKKAEVRLLGETPVDLGNGNWLVAVKDPDGNFIELVGPRN